MKKITPISAKEAFIKSQEVSGETNEVVDILNKCFERIRYESEKGLFEASVETEMISDKCCASIQKSLESYGYYVSPIIMGDGMGFSDCYGFDIEWSSPERFIEGGMQ